MHKSDNLNSQELERTKENVMEDRPNAEKTYSVQQALEDCLQDMEALRSLINRPEKAWRVSEMRIQLRREAMWLLGLAPALNQGARLCSPTEEQNKG